MRRKEKSAEQAFVRWCKERSIRCIKLAGIGTKGYPDRTVFLPNRVELKIEFKANPKVKPNPDQIKVHAWLRELGHEVLVTSSKTEAIAFVEKYLGNLDPAPVPVDRSELHAPPIDPVYTPKNRRSTPARSRSRQDVDLSGVDATDAGAEVHAPVPDRCPLASLLQRMATGNSGVG